MTGRPSVYSPEIEDKICDLIVTGKSLREICAAVDMPCRDTVYAWMGTNKAFSDRYARCIEDRAEFLANEIVGIADNEDGDPQRDRLRIDVRKWTASKLFPKKYSDKIEADLNLKGSIIIQASPLDEKL